MKKYSIMLVCFLVSMAAMSQKPVLNFEVKTHDFGKINETDGKATYVFDFTNKGNSPLVINRVQASCGCTTPTWTKEPVEPGKSGSITVTYNPMGRPGLFSKSIVVYSNGTEEQITLLIKGDVVSKQAAMENTYPVDMNGLSFKTKAVQMNNINKGSKQQRTLEIKNTSNSSIKPTFESLPTYLSVSINPTVLAPNTEGKITFTFDSKKCSLWGPVNNTVAVLINGQKINNNDNKITVYANITEDFSRITIEEKRSSPIVEVPQNTVHLGVIKKGQKASGSFKILNKGVKSLEVRRIINNNQEMKIHQNTLSIGSGKSAQINFDVNTKNLPEGEFKKSINIQTNDPINTSYILIADWTVQK